MPLTPLFPGDGPLPLHQLRYRDPDRAPYAGPSPEEYRRRIESAAARAHERTPEEGIMKIGCVLMTAPRFDRDVVTPAVLAEVASWILLRPVLVRLVHSHADTQQGIVERPLATETELRAVLRVTEDRRSDVEKRRLRSVGAAMTVTQSHLDRERGVRVLGEVNLHEVSLLPEEPRPEIGTYPIESIDGQPAYTREDLAAIWTPLLGEQDARAYVARRWDEEGWPEETPR